MSLCVFVCVCFWIMCMVISVWWATRAGCPHNAANELRLRSPPAPATLHSTPCTLHALAVTGCLLSNCQLCWHFKYKHDVVVVVVVAGVQFPVDSQLSLQSASASSPAQTCLRPCLTRVETTRRIWQLTLWRLRETRIKLYRLGKSSVWHLVTPGRHCGTGCVWI